MSQFTSTFTYTLIYVFGINDKEHKGLLKIGEATLRSDKTPDLLFPNCRDLNIAAKKRIDQYTQTAAISYDLLYTELAVREEIIDGKKKLRSFSDKAVHSVLIRSGITRHKFNDEKKGVEWFPVDLETVKNAIKAVKEGRRALTSNEVSEGKTPIIFRPEQKKAIKETVTRFKTNDHMLWNAKMRFGKTLTALQVAKECGFQKTIIITHRPVVSKGWFEDFVKIFYDTDYQFGSKTQGETIEKLIENDDNKFVYFASIQDLRGSEAVGGKFDKNILEFLIDWDFVIIDEAHEGTQTKLGQTVIELLNDHKKKPKLLELSGTPFNIVSKFSEQEIYTWDYVMEQKAKAEWDKYHFGDSNPYATLPKLQIFTYNLDKLIPGYIDAEDSAFNFHEFFRTWTGKPEKDFKAIPSDAKVGDFVHKVDVESFLNLLCKTDENSNYPYSTEEYRNYFRHSLWMVPGVKEARALSALLKQHPVFKHFNIANVAGSGDEEEKSTEALKKVQDAFGDNPAETYSITLSCGKLTTGVTVPEWTAVFMLAGTFSTSASSYMQTIFRVQSPANINGKIKEDCYVFDFAPDRTLKVVAEAGRLSTRAGDTSSDKVVMGEFLNFCPVIAVEGSNMLPYNVDGLLQQLKRVYTDRVVRNGFDDIHIYNDNLMKLDGLELKDFEDLKKIIGASKQSKKVETVDVNNQGFTDEEYEELERIERKPKKERTPEEIAFLEEKKKKQDNKQKAISILRGISVRIPLLIYGANIPIDKDITIDNFTDLIDDASWKEFMPKNESKDKENKGQGVTKELFKKFAKYYDADIFIAAGRRIRQLAKAADALPPTERVQKIAALFATFKNPDKETVLTPWRVVNMHLSDCLGGYDFYDENHEETIEEPRFVDRGKVTVDTLANTSAQILEINSKTGLYPLYVTYSIYRKRCAECQEELTLEKQRELWNQTVKENVFVICKTEMAKFITQRTLCGYSGTKANAHYFEDLINQLKEKPEQFRAKVTRGSYWNKGVAEMKFDAVVGNPPYQLEGHGQKGLPIYHLFVEMAEKMNPDYISMIMKANWYTDDNELKSFRKKMMNNHKLEALFDFVDSRDCFPDVEIKGGICYFLWNSKSKTKDTLIVSNCKGETKTCSRDLSEEDYGIFVRSNESIKILNKIKSKNNVWFSSIVSLNDPFGFDIREEHSSKRVKIDFKMESFDKSTVFYYNGWRKNGVGYVAKSIIRKHIDWIDMYKVLIPKAWGTGKSDTDRLKPFIANPNSCCTETYLVVGPFKDAESCNNVAKYINTVFFQFCVSLIKITQNSMQGNYRFVPLQDFTTQSDIDWSKSVPEIDKQLYAKYNLDESEIAFIESMIKPME